MNTNIYVQLEHKISKYIYKCSLNSDDNDNNNDNEKYKNRLTYYLEQYELISCDNNNLMGGSKKCCIQSRKVKKAKLSSTTKRFIKKKNLSSRPRTYEIHDNGGRPFKVFATNKHIEIFTYQDVDFVSDIVYDQKVLTIKKFIGYWIGYDTNDYTNFHGNTILIQETKTSYIEIGQQIYRFTTDEEITDYVSPIGGNDVPYPIAYTNNYVYFIKSESYVKKTDLITEAITANTNDINEEFYGNLHKNGKKLEKEKRKLKGYELLVKRR